MIKSPCIFVCMMDVSNKYCVGCYRTLEEIRKWSILSDIEKQSVLDRIDGEKEQK